LAPQTGAAGDHAEQRLIKGGSFLCAFHYRANFRPAAWQAREKDLGTSHVGFRVIYAREVWRMPIVRTGRVDEGRLLAQSRL
jgi:hypothetical protein